ncbi:hypothetical protein B9N43_00655 [Denitratisoma sp. DHT3]|uniref:EthD domain-containing protein n=1 Tax=Denitratisoma sp. DHT3 TaxID=1981880 RepID=UPI0011988EF6|nr:EthD domain-containing protein [Denitratisoma sp. DHT3]QDX79891.1 hypothetical protein B9N43_00655 [Denitratisoma sp. DHT3]
MIKSIAMMKRKPGISHEEFVRYYEEVHAPLGLKHFPFARYVRNFVKPIPGQEEPPFDVITEFWFANEDDHRKALEFNATPAAKIFREDEDRFMDSSKTVGYLVDERESKILR